VINLTETARHLTGMDRDDLAAYLFDEAVLWFGSKIEAKLHVLDKKGNPVYKLEYLLAERKINPTAREVKQAFAQASGVGANGFLSGVEIG